VVFAPVSGRAGPGLDGTHLAASSPMRYPSVSRAPLLLTVADTARRLRRHEQTVRAMIRRGDLAAVRLGRLVRVFAEAVDRTRVLGATETAAGPPRPRRAARA
jgi:excisionase family DNA binding protein